MKKGKLGMLLIGGRPDEGEEPGEDEREDEDSETAEATLETAAEELVDAIAKKDTAAVKDALRSAFSACRELR